MNALDTSVLDMTKHGTIYDKDGHKDCSRNLGELLLSLKDQDLLGEKRKKIAILYDRVGGRMTDHVYRYQQRAIRTVGYLLRLWKQCSGEYFDSEKFKEKLEFDRELLEVEGRRRSGWGAYVQHCHTQRIIREEIQHKKELHEARYDPDIIEKLKNEFEEKRNNLSGFMYIG